MVEKIFPAKVEELDNVTAFIEEECEKIDCPLRDQMQINIALEEMFVNVAHYAYHPEDGLVEVQVSGEDKTLTISLIDSGTPYNPLAKEDPDVTLDAGDRPIGGLGIFMTKKIMDEVEYKFEDGKNIFTMRKKVG